MKKQAKPSPKAKLKAKPQHSPSEVAKLHAEIEVLTAQVTRLESVKDGLTAASAILGHENETRAGEVRYAREMAAKWEELYRREQAKGVSDDKGTHPETVQEIKPEEREANEPEPQAGP